jgi:hypothetical protein
MKDEEKELFETVNMVMTERDWTISDMARLSKRSRSTVYRWFEKKDMLLSDYEVLLRAAGYEVGIFKKQGIAG